MKTWREVTEYSDAFGTTLADTVEIYRVMAAVPLVVLNRSTGKRNKIAARWGFPSPKDWHKPQPIHARAETIVTTKAFAGAFLDGQRGIAIARTFNEAPNVEGPTAQHTITPGKNPVGIAFVWRQFEVGLSVPLTAACMVTVPASKLIATLPTDRMPAVIDPADWPVWLGEREATVDEIKACLRTLEDPEWTMVKEGSEPLKPVIQNVLAIL